jgi:hypothetical protein
LLAATTDSLVLWFGRADLANLATLAESDLPRTMTVYVSSSLLGDRVRALPTALASRALVLHPFVAPEDRDRHEFRAAAWLKANRVTASDRRVAIDVLFAVSLSSDALSHARTLDSREYFVERLEHMASRALLTSTYPSIALGPGRRYGSLGGYVLQAPPTVGDPFRKVAEWFVPSQ